MCAALTGSEDDPSLLKSPLMSTSRPLCVNLPSGQYRAACVLHVHVNVCDRDYVLPDVEDEVKDYQEQVKRMLQDLAKEKEKDVEKPLPLMNQVPR